MIFNAIRGTTYQIAVDGFDGDFGNCLLWIVPARVPPANNNFADRIVLPSGAVTTTGNNYNATVEPGEPDHGGGGGGASVWWSWTAPTSGVWSIKTTGSGIDSLLGVYIGSSVERLMTIASNDDSEGVYTSRLAFHATAGTTYQIAVDEYDPNFEDGDWGGSITLAIAEAQSPANDNFASRITLPSGPLSVTATNRDATREAGEPDDTEGGASVWYSWTAPTSGPWRFATTADFYALVGVYTGVNAGALNRVATVVGNGQMTFFATAGTSYHIGVAGAGGAAGSFTLAIAVAHPPPNDSFASRTVLASGVVTATGTNIDATKNRRAEPRRLFRWCFRVVVVDRTCNRTMENQHAWTDLQRACRSLYG